MTDINVRVVGTANVTQMSGAFGKLEAEVAALNAQLAKMVALQNGVDPTGYNRMAKAAAANDAAFRSAVASTGMFEVQQLRVNKATDTYIDQLKRQKLSFKELIKQRAVAAAAYKEQLAMENMVVKQSAMATSRGRQMLDVMYPKQVAAELDTAGRRLAFFNEQLKSGAHQMINWGKNTQWAGRQMMVGFTMPIVAAGAAAGVLAYQIDKQLTRVAKVYNTTASATSQSTKEQIAYEKELAQVRKDGLQTAMTAAREYGAAATDTLDVQAELAATGLAGQKLQESTAQVMRISMLGELDYQDAIKSTIALQSVFKMSTQELGDAFNYMNAVENSTSLQTKDFAQAIPIAAAPVKAFGGDVKELGILLTAMRERGIEATQGANAIKAAMQRLGRPSKQVQEEWTALTGTDITQIFEKSTSLLDLFQKISDATASLSDKDKIKAFAGLFGTYQVTRMSALVAGMQDLKNGVGQVSEAYRLAGEDSKAWADIADQEVKQIQQSLSGQFKMALEELKIQLSTMGAPFIKMATLILKGISMLIKGFNGLPDIVKWGIAAGIGLMALAGPIVMLAGLFGNLIGTALRMTASLTGLFVKMEILPTESRAAAMAAKLAEAGFIDERTAVQQLTVELEKLRQAQVAANQAMMATPAAAAAATAATQASAVGVVPGMAGAQTRGAVVLSPEGLAAYKAQQAAQDELNKGSKKGLMLESARNKALLGSAAATTAMATGMGIAMFTSGETAGNIANMLILGSIVVPAAMSLAAALKSAAVSETLLAAKAKTVAIWTAASSMNMKSFAANARLAGAAMMSPVGAAGIMAGLVTAIGYGYYKWTQHVDKVTEELAKQNRSLYEQNNLMQDALHIREQTLKTLSTPSPDDVPGKMTASRLAGVMLDTPEMDSIISAYKNAEDETTRNTIATKKYIDVLNSIGGNATKARRYVEALFIAAGDSALQASVKAQALVQQIGSIIDPTEMANLYGSLFANISGATEDSAKEQGTSIGKMIADSIATGANDQADSMMNAFAQQMVAVNDNMFSEIDSNTKDNLATIGVTTSQGLTDILNDYNKLQDGAMNITDFNEKWGEQASYVMSAISDKLFKLDKSKQASMAAAQQAIIDALVEQLGITKEITSFDELRATWEWKLQTVTMGNAKALYDQKIASMQIAQASMGIFGAHKKVNDEQKLAVLNQMRIALGLSRTNDLADGFSNNLVAANANAKNLARTLAVTKDEMANIWKSSMQGVQQDIADTISEGFDNNMQAAIDARQKYWEGRADAQQAQFDREQKALDKKWEKRTDAANEYWDNRIKRVQDEIDAEQKADQKRQEMFQNEIDRINRLNDAMSKNIDFNVALNSGNFDEAAKIRNDMTAAAAQTALEAAAAAGSARSQRRQDQLQNRVDTLNEKKDDYMKRLADREQAEKDHLQKMQDMRSKALQDEQDANMKALQDEWDARKKSLNDQLDLFMQYIAKNKRDLEKHMKDVGLSYKDFGEKTLKPLGEDWSSFYGERMKYHIRAAGKALESDKMWARLGKKSVTQMVQAMGFPNQAQFWKFVETGKLPKNFGKPNATTNAQYAGGTGTNKFDSEMGPSHTPRTTSHTGGWIDDIPGSRKGVAKTMRGLHSSEVLVRAQKGEYMVNRKAAEKHRPLLDAVNSGKLKSAPTAAGRANTSRRNVGYGVGGGFGIAGAMAAAVTAGVMSGFGMAMNNMVAEKMAAATAAGGTYTAGKGGVYGDRSFGPEQLRNAAIIANVGSSMGMSARDIEIGIMTAITESGLVNVTGGDRDSAGLFQQRPSMGWGSYAQVTDPEYAATQFFKHLKAIGDRTNMSPWMAAQAVQRSAFSDGSNYQQYWDEAKAIFTSGLKKDDSGYSPAGYVPGSGGWSKASIPGKGWSNSHDYGNGPKSPLYAYNDGVVTESRAITSGGSAGNGFWPTPYRSYGETIVIRGKDGHEVRYAHLYPGKRFVDVGQQVSGGDLIGLSGNTGNAWGANGGWHTHFEVNGQEIAREWFAANGIGLKVGGTIKRDGTPAILHKDERVLTAPLTKKLDEGIDNIHRMSRSIPPPGDHGPQHPDNFGHDGDKKKHKRKHKFHYPDYVTGEADSPYTWFDAQDVKNGAHGEGPRGTSGASYSGPTGTVGSATYNVRHGSENSSTERDLQYLMSKADIISLQELAARKRPILDWARKQGWGTYNPAWGTGLIWNKDRYNASDLGFKRLANYPIAHNNAVYGRFSAKDGGIRPFYQVSAHTIWRTGAPPEVQQRVKMEQYRSLAQLAAGMTNKGNGVIMGGDFNRTGTSVPALEKILGMKSNRADGLDHLFYNKYITGGKISTKKMHSDHPAVMSSFNVPSLKKGTMGVKYDNTLANLHRDETVLTADISRQFERGVKNFADGGRSVYNDIKVYAHEGQDVEELADVVVRKIARAESRKPGSRRG